MKPITDHRFVGLRQWGIDPPADAPCQYQTTSTNHPNGLCGYSKAQHQIICVSTLVIAGVSYGCELIQPHDGWAHANKDAQAIWGEPTERKEP